MEKELKQHASDCIKVVLFGPESTGKTVLAKQLAEHYSTLWVPEYSRLYAEKQLKKHKKLRKKDVLIIAKGQMALENKLTKQVHTLLICDTDLLETKVYSETYYEGECDPLLEKYALQNTYDLYFLTYIDLPWEADGIRDKPNEREPMFKAFESTLEKYNRPYILLKGTIEDRLQMAIKHINKLLQ